MASTNCSRPPGLATVATCLAIAAMLQACSSGSGVADEPTPAPAQKSGLDARPDNAACIAWPREGAAISLARFTDLTFQQPVALLQAPDDPAHWYVVEQGGAVYRFANAQPSKQLFVTIPVRSGGEMGLLGMAFHPQFPADNRVFVSYTIGSNPLVSRISAFRSPDAGVTLDPASEQVLLTVQQPETNHNGGHIAFGPDGFLYIGFGDGGGGGDAHGDPGNGQRLTTLLGKLLRIDVNGAAPYAIPPTNPFAGNPVCPAQGRASGECPEIYAWGLRNPWRYSFDRVTGELWLADVGQGAWEEVNKITAGGNYGWRCREGAHNFNSDATSGCLTNTLIDPVAEYDHSLGNSITGGYVYRGARSAALAGRYLFGDFVSGRIWAWIEESAATPRQPTLLLASSASISSFAEGLDGELYVVDYGGRLWSIVFRTSDAGGAPQTLSATGCVNPADPGKPASGLIPYDVNAPFWSDGAAKERWLALPNGQRIAARADGDWNLPAGAVLMKHFRFGAQLIETRLLMRHPDGVWGGYSYEWDSQQTDAVLVRGGAVRDIDVGLRWVFPSESQCMQCHTQAAGRTLGLETAQLNRDLTYPQSGRTSNQLVTLSHIGVLTPGVTDPAAQPALPDPTDAGADLAARARSYLHTNCAQCHRPGGPTPSAMDLRYDTPLASAGACNVTPQSGDLGLGAGARLIAPGDSANSLIVNRMDRRDEHAMPPLASVRVDAAGVALIAQWVDALETC